MPMAVATKTLTGWDPCGQIEASDGPRSPHYSEEAAPWKP
jgi:hypothetical protein